MNTTTTRVIHIREARGTPNEIYIGRAGHGHDGYFGNPCAIGTRCPVCGHTHRDGGSTLLCFTSYARNRVCTDAAFAARVRAARPHIGVLL